VLSVILVSAWWPTESSDVKVLGNEFRSFYMRVLLQISKGGLEFYSRSCGA
jgi:hypothetical protein